MPSKFAVSPLFPNSLQHTTYPPEQLPYIQKRYIRQMTFEILTFQRNTDSLTYVVLDRKPCFSVKKFEIRSTKYEAMTKIEMLQ
jgi:hypothetical protein